MYKIFLRGQEKYFFAGNTSKENERPQNAGCKFKTLLFSPYVLVLNSQLTENSLSHDRKSPSFSRSQISFSSSSSMVVGSFLVHKQISFSNQKFPYLHRGGNK